MLCDGWPDRYRFRSRDLCIYQVALRLRPYRQSQIDDQPTDNPDTLGPPPPPQVAGRDHVYWYAKVPDGTATTDSLRGDASTVHSRILE